MNTDTAFSLFQRSRLFCPYRSIRAPLLVDWDENGRRYDEDDESQNSRRIRGASNASDLFLSFVSSCFSLLLTLQDSVSPLPSRPRPSAAGAIPGLRRYKALLKQMLLHLQFHALGAFLPPCLITAIDSC